MVKKSQEAKEQDRSRYRPMDDRIISVLQQAIRL
jgi:hypothetical protein